MNKPTLYILTGLPYSGKSTLARELVKRFGFKVASMDDVMEERKMDPETMTMAQWGEVYEEGYRRLKEHLVNGNSAIIDGGCLLRNERDKFKQIAEGVGAKAKLIYVDTSKDEVLKRMAQNSISKNRGQLSDNTMKRALEMFEEPTLDEKAIIYNQRINLDQWIKENIT